MTITSSPIPPDAPRERTLAIALRDIQISETDGPIRFTGYAAVFNSWSHDLGGFRERIKAGAFRKVLQRQPDVHAVWDHDTRYVLGRTKSGTLRLSEDPRGLRFEIEAPDVSYARDLRELMKRGDIDQASFKFTVARDRWGRGEDGRQTCEVLEVGDLYDVCITAQGAYPDTAAVARSARPSTPEEARRLKLAKESRERFAQAGREMPR